jgi:uncharacterized caspase-like protein
VKFYGAFIGVDDYADRTIRPLKWAVNDASTMYRYFESVIEESSRQLWLLTNEQATRTRVLTLLVAEIAARAEPDDFVLFYFAGHGCPEVVGNEELASSYLATHDTQTRTVFATGVDMQRDLAALFDRLVCRRVILLLDACFSGIAGGRTFAGSAFARRGYRAPVALASLTLGAGRLAIGACGENEVAHEDDALKHGIFTHYLLEGLRAVPQGTSTISVEEWYAQTAQKVTARTNGLQTPTLNGRSQLVRIPCGPRAGR